jgi:hypothetical protein
MPELNRQDEGLDFGRGGQMKKMGLVMLA